LSASKGKGRTGGTARALLSPEQRQPRDQFPFAAPRRAEPEVRKASERSPPFSAAEYWALAVAFLEPVRPGSKGKPRDGAGIQKNLQLYPLQTLRPQAQRFSRPQPLA
jgi:hypothetical protein